MWSSVAKDEDWNEDMPENIIRIGNTMTRMRIMIGRRMIGRMALAKFAPGLELSHIDVLDILKRAQGEVTVGSIAEGMRIDPSRGSRVVADMVGRGLLKRAVSQEDARRSIIEITPMGRSLLQEMRNTKMGIVKDVMDGWSEEDIDSFARLFDKFIGRFESRLSPDAEASTDQKKS